MAKLLATYEESMDYYSALMTELWVGGKDRLGSWFLQSLYEMKRVEWLTASPFMEAIIEKAQCCGP